MCKPLLFESVRYIDNRFVLAAAFGLRFLIFLCNENHDLRIHRDLM